MNKGRPTIPIEYDLRGKRVSSKKAPLSSEHRKKISDDNMQWYALDSKIGAVKMQAQPNPIKSRSKQNRSISGNRIVTENKLLEKSA